MLGCASKTVLNGVAVRTPPPEKIQMTVTDFLKVRGKGPLLQKNLIQEPIRGEPPPPPTKLVLHGIVILFRERMELPFFQCKQPSIGQVCQNILGKCALSSVSSTSTYLFQKGRQCNWLWFLFEFFASDKMVHRKGWFFVGSGGGAGGRQEKKPININILGGTVSGTNRNRPGDKRDPSPGPTGTCPWDKPAFFCLIPQSPEFFF